MYTSTMLAWQMPAETNTNIVDVYINYLRRKLAAGGFHDANAGLIETVRGMGYRLGALSCRPVAQDPGLLSAISRAAYA